MAAFENNEQQKEIVESVESVQKEDYKPNFLLSSLSLLEFYLHLQTFFVIFSSYRFQMKEISTLEIQCTTTSDEAGNSNSWV